MRSNIKKTGMKLKASLSLAAVAVMLLVAVSPLMISNDSSAKDSDGIWINPFTEKVNRQNSVPDGYIGIYVPEDLNKIGTDVDSIYDDPESPGNKLKWSMEAKYIQMSDLDFTGKNLNGGFEVRITITTGADLAIHVEYDLGYGYLNAPGVNVWIDGKKSTADATGVATYNGYDSSREYPIVIGGSPGSNNMAVAFIWKDGMSSTLIKDSNGNMDPIGSSASPFTGEYDGNGWKIKGADFAVYSAANSIAALFGYFSYSTTLPEKHIIVKNLGMDGGTSVAVSQSTARASNVLGTLVGGNKYPIVENCYNTSDVFSAGDAAFAGGISSFGAIPVHCSNSAAITGYCATSSLYVGGVAGQVPGAGAYVSSCYNYGDVYGSSSNTSGSVFIGGVVGSATRGVFECFNTGTIKAVGAKSETIGVGGLIGTAESARYCYNYGDVILSASTTATLYEPYHWMAAGGIVGQGVIVEGCYNKGSVTVVDVHAPNIAKAYIGGIIGNHNGETGTYGWTLHHSYFLEGLLSFNGAPFADVLSSHPNSYANYEETIKNNSLSEPTVAGLGAMDANEIKDPENFKWWKIGHGDVWNLDPTVNGGAPYLMTFSCMEIISHPSSCTVDCDSDAIFSIDAGSSWNLTYKWQIDRGNGWEDLSETGNTCSFLSVKEEHHDTKFRCVVYSDFGVIVSNHATLSIKQILGSHDGSDCWTCMIIKITAIVLALLAVVIIVYAAVLGLRSRK